MLIIMDTLFGAMERITFYNPENGYTVLRLRPDAHLDAHPGVKRWKHNLTGTSVAV